MKKHAINFLLLAVAGALVYGLLQESHSAHVSHYVLKVIQPARDFYHNHPLAAVALFWCVHFLSSALSVPGNCSILNSLSGAVFGFWMGCAVVYPITIVSAVVVYFLGKKLRQTRLIARRLSSIETWGMFLQQREFMFFVTLRLSPIFPFGLLSIIEGVVGVPFSTYLMTTVIGVFFDVTLFNSLGAGLVAGSAQSEKSLAISFVVILSLFFLLRTVLAKAYNLSSRGRVQ